MKNKIIMVVLILSVCLQTACIGRKEINPIEIYTKVDCLLTVPNSSQTDKQVWFQVPFYSLYSGSDRYSNKIKNKNKYVVGEEAFLSGLHTQALQGAYVIVTQTPFSALADERFYETLSAFEAEKSEGQGKKAIKKAISPYQDNTYVVSFNLVFHGCISENISVESLTIPSMGISFPFERFQIETIELPESVAYDDGTEMITYTSGGATLVSARIEKTGFTFVDGYANKKIDQIELKSANEICEVINESNYNNYADLEEMYGPLYSDQKLDSYNNGDEIALSFNYILKDSTQQLLDKEVLMISMVIITKDENGTEHWSFRYEANACPGEYLIYRVLN